MLIILLNWCYVLFTLFIIGHFLLKRTAKAVRYQKSVSNGTAVIFGIGILTAYAGYFSIFYKVGLLANALLLAVCAVCVWFDRTDYPALFHSIKGKFKVWQWAIFALILLFCLYFTAYGKFAYDTGLYHAQSIHWIEEYGVVKGLAYMQTRLAFNSSFFCLCALYSFHDLGQSLHTLSGFIAAFTMIYAAAGFFMQLNKKEKLLTVSNFVRLSPFLYFTVICQELVSPTTDFITIYLIIWIAIRWVELLDKKEQEAAPYAILCVLSVFLISLKLSVGVLALLVIKPAYQLIKEKRVKDIFLYMTLGILLVLPYFIRNVLISGWLIYPFAGIDLFSVDWKVPASDVRYEADEITVWARYTKDAKLIDQSIREWFPIWWQEQGKENRYLSLAAFLAFGVELVQLLFVAVSFIRKKAVENLEYIYFEVIFTVSFLFWLLSAPSNRFGYSYLTVLPLVVLGTVLVPCTCTCKSILKKTSADTRTALRSSFKNIAPYLVKCAAALIVFGTMAISMLLFFREDGFYVRENISSDYLIAQKDYPIVETGSKDFEGLQIYFPVEEGTPIWYHAFPANLYEGNLDSIERRGNTMRDGFRLKVPRE